MGIVLPFLLVWLFVIYLPFAMLNWHAFLGLCMVYLLIGLGVRYGVATYSAAEVPVILVAIGNFWIELVVGVIPIPIIARAVALTAKSLGLSGRPLLAINVIGILALPGSAVGIDLFQRWERRPASAYCTAKPIQLMLSGIEGSVPWSKAINLFLGPDIRKDSRSFFSPTDQRSVCHDTSDGSKRLTITALSIRPQTGPDRCLMSGIQRWEQTLCAKSEDDAAGPLPSDVTIFDPDGIQLRNYGIPAVATNGDYPLDEDQKLISVASSVLGTVTAVCRSQPGANHAISCQMRRPIADGIDIYWEIYTHSDAVNDDLLKAETFAFSVCSGVFGLPACAASPTKHP